MYVVPKVDPIEVFQVTDTTTQEELQEILGENFTVDLITGFHNFKYRVWVNSNCQTYYLRDRDYFTPMGYQGFQVFSEARFKHNYVEVDKL